MAALIALLLAAASAWFASTPPARPATAFDGARAMATVRTAFARPHPIGSAENARVRGLLLARLAALGAAPVARPMAAGHRTGDGFSGADVTNIVGVLPGRDRTLPALLLMAHYDTVPASPGAGDDGIGVATLLEIARLLRAGPGPRRDVILLLTDGEEAGLVGARAFFAGDPLRGRVGMVVNMDMRGDAGRAIMYETGTDPAGLIRLYAAVTPHPTTDSIAAFVRRNLRNSSDFAIAAEAGLPGLNYAVIGNQFGYHAASSTPDALDPRTSQHFGDTVWPVARALALSAAWPAAGPEPAWASLWGIWTIVWPHAAGWPGLAVAAAIGGAALRRTRWRDAVAGLALALGVTLGSALLIHLLRRATGVPDGFTAVRPLLARWGLFETAILASGAGVLLLAAGWRHVSTLPAGLFLLALVAGIAVQALAPAAAVLPILSLLAAALVLALAPRHPLAAAIPAGLGLGQVLATGHLILLSVGESMPAVAAWFVLLGGAIVAPLVGRHWARPAGLAAIGTAIGLVLVIRLAPVGTPDRPRPSQVMYVADLGSGRFARVSTLPAIDPWTDAALRADGAGGWRRGSLDPLFTGPYYRKGVALAPARPVAVTPPRIAARRVPCTFVRVGGAGRPVPVSLPATCPPGHGDTVTIVVTPPPGTRQVDMALRPDVAGELVSLAGVPAALPMAAGRALRLHWSAPAGPVAIVLRPDGPGRIAGRLGVMTDTWPAGARPLPPRPAGTMPWYQDGATILLVPVAIRW